MKKLSGHEMIKALSLFGFEAVRQKGSHVILKKEDFGCVVPLHKELKIGTMKSILKMAKIPENEFMDRIERKK
ncbi:MAG: type II toxin-antitoxin system HicA family toxin [Candidatus Aenigmarchaeota archaeon]|nr:type II toxin-antitoxin system HicA family toxin [Candidatus Aenigmarchaeota archaeon]MCK5062879.1 type II toxin-antitoxin system HicA family toxin [Candidatus Aenigmarchaeota archaeon]